jgi:hypothetical protein
VLLLLLSILKSIWHGDKHSHSFARRNKEIAAHRHSRALAICFTRLALTPPAAYATFSTQRNKDATT